MKNLPTVKSFDEWLETHKAAEDHPICPLCHNDAHTCRFCGGTGMFDSAINLYKRQVQWDYEQWVAWNKGAHSFS